MIIAEQEVKLNWITPNPEQEIERAGRVCYKSEDKITPTSAGKFVKRLKDSGHHAMLEHATASFTIITDRGISHEIVRHRIASYAQESTRYCNYSQEKFGKHCTFILPPNLNTLAYNLWVESCLESEKTYFELLETGVSPQIARSVLPTCLKTEIRMTANLREWMHFIALRESSAAHPQIREIAQKIRVILAEYAPNIFDKE